MPFRSKRPRLSFITFVSLAAIAFLGACVASVPSGSNTGLRINASEPVEVALLVPGGSLAEADNFLATNLENAARLAIADLSIHAVQNRQIELLFAAEVMVDHSRVAFCRLGNPLDPSTVEAMFSEFVDRF